MAADYADATSDGRMLEILRFKSLAWYGVDRDAQAWEPSGEDFLSPTLMEAACMARLLPAKVFEAWFDAFLPHLDMEEPKSLFEPARASSVTARTAGLRIWTG